MSEPEIGGICAAIIAIHARGAQNGNLFWIARDGEMGTPRRLLTLGTMMQSDGYRLRHDAGFGFGMDEGMNETLRRTVGGKLVSGSLLLMLVLGTMLPLLRAVPAAAAQGSNDLPGMVDDQTFESPQFGTTVSWTDAWQLGDVNDPNVAHAIGGYSSEPVISDPTTGDAVYLSDTDTGTAVITVSMAPSAATLADLEAQIQTDAFLEDNVFMAPGAEILSVETKGDTIGMLVRDTGAKSDHAVYLAVMVPSRASDPLIMAAIDLFDPETYQDSLDLAESDLTIDGFDFFATHRVDDLVGLLDDGNSKTGTDRGTRPTPTTEATTRTTRTTGSGTMTADEYLAAIRDDTDLRAKQLDRLSAILLDDGTVTSDEERELTSILNEWGDLEPIPAPDGFAEIDDEHRALVKNLNALGSSLLQVATADLTDEERDQQTALAGGSYQTSLALVEELDALLKAEGV